MLLDPDVPTATQMSACVSMTGGWTVKASKATWACGAKMSSVVLDPWVVHEVTVSLDNQSGVAYIHGAGGYGDAGSLGIISGEYAYSTQEHGCPSLVVLDNVSVALALAQIPVDLRLAFTTPTDLDVFTAWFVRSARAAHDARQVLALQPTGQGQKRTRRTPD